MIEAMSDGVFMASILGVPNHPSQGTPNYHPVRIAYMGTLKERIADALSESGKTQTDLAAACGVKPPSVNDWLSGKTKSLKASTAQRAAAFLKVNMLWLTEGRGPKRRQDSGQAVDRDSEQTAMSVREQEADYGPTVTDREVTLLRDLRELLADRQEYYAEEIRREASVARAYKAMGYATPATDERVGRFIGTAPAVPPVERRRSHDRRTARLITTEGGEAPQKTSSRRLSK